MTSGPHPPPGSPSDGLPDGLPDVELGRLLSEGLHRQVHGPVDERRLVDGARRGAARIRRRRTAAMIAAVVVLAVPAGALTVQRFGSGSQDTTSAAGSAASAEAASASPQAAAGAASDDKAAPSPSVAAPSVAVPLSAPASAGAPSSAAAGSIHPTPQATAPAFALPRTATGEVAVPATALLDPAALTPVLGATPVVTQDSTAARPPTAADLCGRTLSGLGVASGSRAQTYAPTPATAAAQWTAVSAARVFAGSGAHGYLSALAGQTCLTPLAHVADEALLGHGPADSHGRIHWFGVVRSGRAVAEVWLVAPSGVGVTRTSAARLLGTAAGRLTASGLPATAAADPGLS